MVWNITCSECGSEIPPNVIYCPNCKCNAKPAAPKNSADASPNRIKLRYYFGIASILGSIMIMISGLSSGDYFVLAFGAVIIALTLVRFPKQKKEFDKLSKK